jgi:hypothetical protein
MTILTLGDSFTFGAELQDVPSSLAPTGQHQWDDQNQQLIPVNPSKFAWPSLLGEKFNQEVENMAVVGGSNSRIFRRAVASGIEKNYDLIICAWTSIARLDISYQGQECVLIAGNPVWPWAKTFFADHFEFNQEIEKWLAQVLALQSLFKIRNQKYIFVNALKNNVMPEYNYLVQHIDKEFYLDWDRGFQAWCKHSPRGPGGHFLEQGHELVANNLENFIKQKNLL